MNLHANIGKPMTTNEVLSLFRIMALCKAVTGAYHKHSVDVSRSSLHIVQHIQMQILTIIQAAKVSNQVLFLYIVFVADIESDKLYFLRKQVKLP